MNKIPSNISFEAYLALKNEVNDLYEKMMKMHFENRRDSAYANARAAYMEKKNLLQQAQSLHPEYEANDKPTP